MIERIIIIDGVDPQTFYGVNNANISLIRNLFPKLRVSARGNVVKVIGEEHTVATFFLGIFTVTPGSGSPSESKTNPVTDDLLVAYPAVPSPVC